MAGELPADWAEHAAKAIVAANDKAETIATRKASQIAINALAPAAARTPRRLRRPDRLQPDHLDGLQARHPASRAGNYIYYGVREFGMSAIMNGMALHGGFSPSAAPS